MGIGKRAATASEEDMTSRHTEALERAQFGGGRLGTYTVLGAATGVVPLPWVPDAIARRLRGALIHDLTARHGLSITPDARKVLVEGEDEPTSRRYLKAGAVFAATRVLGRFGPLALLAPVRSAIGTFVLGHLVQRYLEVVRTTRSVRIDVEEARRIRSSIDRALVEAVTTEGRGAPEDRPFASEDLRDPTTQLVDGIFISIASAPGWLVRRLDAAFDAIWAASPSG
jgi:hypothetical protein